MKLPNRFDTRAFAAVTFAAILAVAGCGDDGLGKRFPVKGTVTYQGKPVKKGTINFIPEKADTGAASGSIEDGSFSLTTLTPGDGAFPGKYTVTIDAKEVDTASLNEAAKKKGATSGMIPQDISAAAFAKAKSAVPAKYGSLSTTPLKDFVIEPKSNSPKFDLVD